MIGIYKITNLRTLESYIGQSLDIENRFKEHINHKNSIIGREIEKYGINNFSFEVLEECDYIDLDRLEQFYIKAYDSIENGYNRIKGGQCNVGEANPNAKLTESDIFDIREAYEQHCSKRAIYDQYKDKVSFNYFSSIWEGRSWKHIRPDVFTDENKNYYKYKTSIGENSKNSTFSDQEVIELRKRYVYETAKQIYDSVKDRCSFQTLQCILWGRYYSHLKIYDKKEKKWK